MRPKRGARGCGPSPTGLLRRCRRCGPHRRAVTIRAGTVQSELAEGEQLGPSFHLGDPHHQHRYLQRDPPTAQKESLRERSSDGLQRALPTATLRFTCEVLLVGTSSKKYRGSYVARSTDVVLTGLLPSSGVCVFLPESIASWRVRRCPELAKIVAGASPRGFIEASPASSSPPSEGLGPRTQRVIREGG
jgi:hypothetical protein